MITRDEAALEARAVIDDAGVDNEAVEETTQSTPVSRLVFRIAGHGLLLHQQAEMEFLENQTPFHIPNNHPLFRGLINRRGSLVPVFDIRDLINQETRAPGASRVLVLGTGDDAVGVVLDATPYRITVTEEERAPLPGKLVQVFGRFLGDCYRQDGTYFTHVALEDFLYNLVHEVK